MSSIKTGVTKGFEALGLTVEADRGGLTVSDGLDGEKMVVRIDENERVIRVERAICYPIDDFSPELSRAMDFLNQQRQGVCFAYDESQRALLVATAWTSPSRDPSPNQLQLLVGLVLEAAGRDGPALERVAEGELTAEDLRQHGGAPEDRQAALTTRFNGACSEEGRGSDQEWPDAGEQATRPMPQEEPRVTTKFMTHVDGEEGERRDPVPEAARKSGMTRRFEELDQFASRAAAKDEGEAGQEPAPARRGPARGGASDDEPKKPQELTPRQGMSRSALQMAVYRQEHDKPEKVDMTAGRRSLGFRLVRGLFALAIVGGLGYVVWVFFVGPFFGNKDPLAVVRGWFKSAQPVDQIDPRIPAREKLQGKELLLAELEDPLTGELHDAYINRALSALPDKTAELIDIIAGHKMPDVRQRAYAVWKEAGLDVEDATRMRLLRALVEKGRAEERGERLTAEVLGGLKLRPPTDEALIAALAWAKGPPWLTIVELLGQPGEPTGARKRSEALATQLAKDTEDFQVLRAMVKTGFAPPDAAARLVQGRGLEWARGAEGKEQLTRFITESPDSITPLLRHEDEEYRLLAVELLIASAQPAAVDRLAKVALRDASLRVRLKTAIGLGSIGNADAAWPLAVALARRDPAPEEAFVAEVKSALGRLPIDQCVARLREHLAHTLQMSERYYAVGALACIPNAGGLPAILEALRDPDPQVRRKALQVCEELQEQGHKIDSGLAQYRALAREDPDPNVRTAAARLYKAVTGRDP